MSVLMRGVDMPKNCEECNFKGECRDYWEKIRKAYTRPSWCPLVEVNCSEKPNNSLDKDTNVRSKEPQTDVVALDKATLMDYLINSVDENDEPAWTEKHVDEILKDFDVVPKTEPQSNILLDAIAKAFGIEDEPQR